MVMTGAQHLNRQLIIILFDHPKPHLIIKLGQWNNLLSVRVGSWTNLKWKRLILLYLQHLLGV